MYRLCVVKITKNNDFSDKNKIWLIATTKLIMAKFGDENDAIDINGKFELIDRIFRKWT